MFFLTGVISPFQREDHLFRACFSKFSFFLSPLSTVLLLGFSVFFCFSAFLFLFASTLLYCVCFSASLFFWLSVFFASLYFCFSFFWLPLLCLLLCFSACLFCVSPFFVLCFVFFLRSFLFIYLLPCRSD